MKLGSGGNNFLEDASVKQFIGYILVFRMGYSWRESGVLSCSYSQQKVSWEETALAETSFVFQATSVAFHEEVLITTLLFLFFFFPPPQEDAELMTAANWMYLLENKN